MSIIIPGIIALILIVAAAKKVDILSAFSEGVKNGLSTVLSILPILILVLTAIEMLKASHLLELAVSWIAPMTEKIGIPSEILPLALLKPLYPVTARKAELPYWPRFCRHRVKQRFIPSAYTSEN